MADNSTTLRPGIVNSMKNTDVRRLSTILIAVTITVTTVVTLARRSSVQAEETDLQLLRHLRSRSSATVRSTLRSIEKEWHPGEAVMLLESSRFAATQANKMQIIAALARKTGQQFALDHSAWYRWLWSQEYEPHPDYAEFKSDLYSNVDKRFVEYFTDTDDARIRRDEIRWGGVKRDGIPPLRNPKMIPAQQADYLQDSNVVFGIELNGEARCYPKRILAWHEMFKDTIGDESFCGVY